MPSNINTEGEAKTIDIDDKGPGADITLPDEKKENENEAIIENVVESDNTSEKSDEQLDVRDEKNEGGEVKKEVVEAGSDKQPDNNKEIEEYSDGVKKRIAKLTKKMREAERQKDITVAEIRSAGYGAQVDINENKESDFQDAMKDIRQRDQYREQMDFKREQATVNNADSKTKLSLEKEKLATQRDIASKNLQIARENKNKYDVKDTKEKKKKKS